MLDWTRGAAAGYSTKRCSFVADQSLMRKDEPHSRGRRARAVEKVESGLVWSLSSFSHLSQTFGEVLGFYLPTLQIKRPFLCTFGDHFYL